MKRNHLKIPFPVFLIQNVEPLQNNQPLLSVISLRSTAEDFRYPELWGLNEARINWGVSAWELAASLTNKLGRHITTSDVKEKVSQVKSRLKYLNTSEGPARTTLTAFLWYAIKLDLHHAADRITKQLISDGKIKTFKKKNLDGFLECEEKAKENMDERFLPPLIEMTTGERTTTDMETDELTGGIPIDNTMLKERQRTKAQLQVELQEEYHEEYHEEYLEEYMEEDRTMKKETDNVISNVEELREIVRSLTPYDRIVSLYFDEVYANQQTTYSTREDRLYGCSYDSPKRAVKDHRIVLFDVRSLLTGFNMLLSANTYSKSRGKATLLDKNIELAEQIGLHNQLTLDAAAALAFRARSSNKAFLFCIFCCIHGCFITSTKVMRPSLCLRSSLEMRSLAPAERNEG
uniref:Uncharacterized protein n=1 Tax=Glossina pallidipes TaxID=7398 RepID=A0A1B0A3W6_GLOPL